MPADSEAVETKYRLIFLNDSDYREILGAIDKERVFEYGTFKAMKIKNFSVGKSDVIFVHKDHYQTLMGKAGRGGQLP